MQQDVIDHCRSALNIRAQEDAVHAVFPFANKSGGVKIKIAFLFVTVSQAIRKILLAELLEDFLLVTRLKAGQYRVFLVEHCAHAFIEDFSCVEKTCLQSFLFIRFYPFTSHAAIFTWYHIISLESCASPVIACPIYQMGSLKISSGSHPA